MALTTIDDRGLKTPIDLLDSEKIRFGTGNDLELYHDGASRITHTGAGNLIISTTATDSDLYLRGKDKVVIQPADGEDGVICNANGSVELYYDNSKKLETTSTGATLSGDLIIDDSTPIIKMKVTDDAQSTLIENYNTADNIVSRIYGGTDGELRLETGTNGTEKAVVAKPDAEVQLFYNGSKKAYTQTTGMVFTNNNAPNLALDSSPVKLVLDNTSSHDWDHDEHCGAIIFKKGGNIVSGITGTHTRTGSGHSNEDGGIQIWTSPSAQPTVPEQVWEFDSVGSFVGKDNHKILLGDSNDLQIYHNGSHSFLTNSQNGLYARSDEILLQSNTGNENYFIATLNGAAELYHNNVKTFETTSSGIKVLGPDADYVTLDLFSDEGQHGADMFRFHVDDGGPFHLKNYKDGAWENNIVVTGAGSVDLYHDNTKVLWTDTHGMNSQAKSGDFQFNFLSAGGNQWGIWNQDNNMRFMEDSTERMRIYSTGNIGAPTGSNIYNASDQRLKENITTLTNGLDKIKALNPVSFNWIDGFCDEEKDKTLYGFIAQEANIVDSNLVDEFGTGTVEVNGKTIEDALTVNEKFVIPLLTAALKEAITKIETLETKVTALEDK